MSGNNEPRLDTDRLGGASNSAASTRDTGGSFYQHARQFPELAELTEARSADDLNADATDTPLRAAPVTPPPWLRSELKDDR